MLPYYHRGINLGSLGPTIYRQENCLEKQSLLSQAIQSYLIKVNPSVLQLAINLINIGCRRLSPLTLAILFSLIFYPSISFRLNICAYRGTCKAAVVNFITMLLN
ncbi:hypothetical protein M9H77_31096 [Catharanthus roseus]|uniref:Uncharacterized protein n=1 Tax=Catharanthus roseus TaxID=4058 RepID=A0ACC0A159_CATRO|nr:hypothetical protein M9H77_31096 [Catharanthus roseus]